LGLVPRQSSSGGKPTLLGMSKRGDAYLRTLLIHGARSAILAATNQVKPDGWLSNLLKRRHPRLPNRPQLLPTTAAQENTPPIAQAITQ
jgi:transposase